MVLALITFLPPLFCQPLLLIGKSDAELSGAFSYGFLRSPLSRPFDHGAAEASLNLPFNASAKAQRFIGSISDSTFAIPELFARVSQDVNAHIDVSAPMFGGVGFFAARENATLSVTGALGNARFNLDTTLEGAGSVLLKGSIHMPLLFEMSWRSLSFGYAYHPSPWITIGFQVHKHLFYARTSGDLRPDLSGRMSVGGESGNTSFLVEYPDTKVYGRATGDYEGKTWAPEMGIGIGPVRLVSRMGARLFAKGHVDVTYSVPYFIDPETFEPRFTSPDSFLTSDNLRRLLDSETRTKSLHIVERLVLTLPESHSLSIDLWPEHISLSYTKVFGNVSIHAEKVAKKPALDSGAAIPADSSAASTKGFVDLDLFPDQVLCLSGKFDWFHTDLGFHTLNISYRDKDHLLSDLTPLTWDGDPFVPIFDFGFTWGYPLIFATDFFISPLPAVRSGISYAF
jgi:hypothetical protein